MCSSYLILDTSSADERAVHNPSTRNTSMCNLLHSIPAIMAMPLRGTSWIIQWIIVRYDHSPTPPTELLDSQTTPLAFDSLQEINTLGEGRGTEQLTRHGLDHDVQLRRRHRRRARARQRQAMEGLNRREAALRSWELFRTQTTGPSYVSSRECYHHLHYPEISHSHPRMGGSSLPLLPSPSLDHNLPPVPEDLIAMQSAHHRATDNQTSPRYSSSLPPGPEDLSFPSTTWVPCGDTGPLWRELPHGYQLQASTPRQLDILLYDMVERRYLPPDSIARRAARTTEMGDELEDGPEGPPPAYGSW